MSPLALLVVMAATGAAVYAALRLALKHLNGFALARPSERSNHARHIPQIGGLAVVPAVLIAAGVAALAMPLDPQWTRSLSVALLAAAALMVLGALDDARGLAMTPRLAVHTLAAAAVAATLPASVQLVPALPLAAERVAIVLALVWYINLTNFMDGIDWMSVAETVPIAAAVLVLTIAGLAPQSSGWLAAALLAAVAGFAPFNKPTARVFLGDCGSLPIGLLVGWMLIAVASRAGLTAALILPLYYLADATLTVLRRLARGDNIAEAHSSHFYQRAARARASHGWVVAQVALTNMALAGLAIYAAAKPEVQHQIVAATAAVAVAAATLWRMAKPPAD